jgi:hypothetical protein
MKNNTKTIIASIILSLACGAVAKAQSWGGSYSSSYTGPNGRTASYNQSYTQGPGGFMNTGCPQGVGWAIFAINALGSLRSGAPIPTPVSIGAAGGGGYYGGGGYGCAGGGGYYQPTYRAGWGISPY